MKALKYICKSVATVRKKFIDFFDTSPVLIGDNTIARLRTDPRGLFKEIKAKRTFKQRCGK